MKSVAAFAVACGIMCSAVHSAWSDDPHGESDARDSVDYVTLPDGPSLVIATEGYTEEKWDKLSVEVVMYSRLFSKNENEGSSRLWSTYVTSVENSRGTRSYYALVKVTKDRIVVVSLWNDRYFVLDKHTGRVLKKGNGDDVLKKYMNFTPVRLFFCPASASTTGSVVDQRKSKQIP